MYFFLQWFVYFIDFLQDISYTPEKYAIDSAIHLVENGATLDIQNKKNMKPLDMLDDDSLKKNLQERAKQRQD